MKTYGATSIFKPDGNLITEDIHQLAIKIVEAETRTIANEHESKLIRVEIGAAIRVIAMMRASTLTDAIIEMDLCKTTNRAEKTFLKYARIAGSETLMTMAENPQVSLSVLDEIAACKKPVIKEDRAVFMKRVCSEVQAICDENVNEEGYGDKKEEGRFIALGITRNEAVGIIRRVQIEMGVETKAGGGDPDKPDKKGPKAIQSKLLQLVHLMRIAFLPTDMRDAWLAKHGLSMGDVGANMIALQNELVDQGTIPRLAADLKPEAIYGLKKIAIPTPE